jgi:manganese/zinc/iron transport system ATP- binding protein
VPQRSSVDWDFPITALEVVMMGLYAKRGLFSFCGKKYAQKALIALEKVGMSSFADRQISELSGGQQQRVFIARALVQEADIYFMDEPFAGVDMTTEDSIVEILTELKRLGKTLFIVHHDLNSARKYFDMAILLNTSLIACGDINDVLTDKNMTLAYGQKGAMLGVAIGLARQKNAGLK